MKIDKNIAELICALEYEIGNQTYNPKSYNGWTGEEGCEYKYPVNYCKTPDDLQEKRLTKTKTRINYIDAECVNTMRYAFGANHLYIGDGIVEALEYLEERYGIDFNELEEKRTKNRIEKMRGLSDKLNAGEEIKITQRRLEVGVDIPAGKYIVSNDSVEAYVYVHIDIRNDKGEVVDYHFVTDEEVEMELLSGYIVTLNRDCVIKKK